MDIADKHILITGGRRVGQHVAKALQNRGAKVSMSYLDQPNEVAANTNGFQLNVNDEPNIRKFFKTVTNEGGPIHGLVNMVSVFSADKEKLTYDDMIKTFLVNAFGNMLMSRLFAEAAQKRAEKAAPIVSFIDWAVDHPYSKYTVYLSAKAALRHYLMALQVSFAGTIRIVNIQPGMLLEPSDFPENEKMEIIRHTPVRDIGSAKQAADLVVAALELDYLADNINLAGGQQWRHRLF